MLSGAPRASRQMQNDDAWLLRMVITVAHDVDMVPLDHYRAILKHSKHLPGIKEPVLHHEKENEPTNWLFIV